METGQVILSVDMLAAALAVTLALRKALWLLKHLKDSTEEEGIILSLTNHQFYGGGALLFRLIIAGSWLAALYHITGIYEPLSFFRARVAEDVVSVFSTAFSVIYQPLFVVGDQEISLSFLAVLGLLIAVSAVVSGFFRSFFRRQVLERLDLSEGVQESLATAVGYLVLGLALLISLEIVGVDLSTLAVIAGALSIGIGFGLQNIVNNFISGLILLLERPVEVGDRIEVGDTHGRVMKISARSTTVRTNDNIDIIVPNSELVVDRLVNWSQDSRRVRFRVPVGVAYRTDVRKAMELIVEAAEEVEGVLSASVRFVSFGDSALNLEAMVWTTTRLHRRAILISDVNLAIFEKFRENDIEIPYPQRDLHIKSEQ